MNCVLMWYLLLTLLSLEGQSFEPPIRLLKPTILSSAHPRSVDIGVAEIPGIDSDRPQKVNQDAHFVEIFEDGVICVGVLDGHGLKGHLVSQFIATQLPKSIREQLDCLQPVSLDLTLGNDKSTLPENRIEAALIHAFHSVHKAALENETVPAGRSGTTCIVLLIDRNTIVSAYVGDSRAIQLGLREDEESYSVIASETTTKIPLERQRIEACEGRIDGQGNVWYGPVAISMTRALGDAVMLRAGVLPTPLTRSFSILPEKSNSSVIILATDGIWDVLNEHDVRIIVDQSAGRPAQETAEILAHAARSRWIGEFIDAKADDITCMIIRW